MWDRVYCYPDTDVLINRLNIKDNDKLHSIERKLTMLRLLELLDNPIKGDFDFKHLHPFREGNGRAQREFIRSLAYNCGYIISFDKITKEEMLEASEKSFLCDYTCMEVLFRKCIKRR